MGSRSPQHPTGASTGAADSSARLNPTDPAGPDFRQVIGSIIEEFLAGQRDVLAGIGPELDALWHLAAAIAEGGKRMRPAFCYWGYVAADETPDQDHQWLLRAAASLDLLHASALVHDDVIDGSDLRRGQPAAHRALERQHRQADWLGDPERFGRAGAILLGNLLVMWSAEMLQHCGVEETRLAAALPILEAMRTEVTCGQYLDVVAQSHSLQPGEDNDPSVVPPNRPASVESALNEARRVVEFKSARYTVQRPAQFGAALAGGSAELMSGLAAFGSPLGIAFQFRDDLLGVFWDSELTGKPAGDDLREGKRTVLIAHTYAGSDRTARRGLDELFGRGDLDPAGIARLREIITASGARDAVESMIDTYHQQAMQALDATPMTDAGRQALTALADAAVRRQF